jgi:ribosomal protein S18 acetylase RimI-like enzyme
MSNFQIKNLLSGDIPALMQLQHEYARNYPGVQILPGGLYLSPAFHQGQDIFCAYHPNGQMLGFSVVYAQLPIREENKMCAVWAEVKIVPSMNSISTLRDNLLDLILKRTRELTLDRPGLKVEMNFQYFPYEVESIAFIKSKGFQYNGSIYMMQCDLSKPLSTLETPEGYQLKPWQLETQAEREMYIQARNLCFPNAPITLDEWIYFMSSPAWSTATNYAVFHQGKLAGCLTTYWDEEKNRNLPQKVGYTEYIFVCPQWRRKGLASAMITNALQYLQQNGMHFAQLQVRTDNRDALTLYEKLGFTVIQESGIYTRQLDFI